MPARHGRTSTIQQRVGRRIRELRERVGISQAELARRMTTSPSHLHALEKGRRAMTITTLEAIAQGLGVEIPELFPGKDAAPAPPVDRAWLRVADKLRGRDARYLRCVEELLGVLDRARP